MYFLDIVAQETSWYRHLRILCIPLRHVRNLEIRGHGLQSSNRGLSQQTV